MWYRDRSRCLSDGKFYYSGFSLLRGRDGEGGIHPVAENPEIPPTKLFYFAEGFSDFWKFFHFAEGFWKFLEIFPLQYRDPYGKP